MYVCVCINSYRNGLILRCKWLINVVQVQAATVCRIEIRKTSLIAKFCTMDKLRTIYAFVKENNKHLGVIKLLSLRYSLRMLAGVELFFV